MSYTTGSLRETEPEVEIGAGRRVRQTDVCSKSVGLSSASRRDVTGMDGLLYRRRHAQADVTVYRNVRRGDWI